MSERTLLLFDSVCLGLTRCINTAREDIATCEEQRRKAHQSNGRTNELAEESLAATRYIKRLEINLGHLETLRHNYSLHLKMSQGSLSLYRAHSLSSSTSLLNRKWKKSLASSGDLRSILSSTLNAGTRARSRLNLAESQSSLTKSTKVKLKDYLDNMETIESEFKSMMGTFIIEIQNILGYARICNGDTFEISIRYGDASKFKTKIRVLRNGKQKCDQMTALFKVGLADAITIEAYECKSFGKKLLGTKLCEIMDFFSPHSQLLTVNLNQTGSIKLNMIITWNPLHLSDVQ